MAALESLESTRTDSATATEAATRQSMNSFILSLAVSGKSSIRVLLVIEFLTGYIEDLLVLASDLSSELNHRAVGKSGGGGQYHQKNYIKLRATFLLSYGQPQYH